MKKALCLLLAWVCLGIQISRAQGGTEEMTPVTHTYALKNVTIIQKPGQVIQKGIVVVKNGLIHAVGPNVAIPANAKVIEGDSMFVYAGFIDGLSQTGIPRPEPAQAGSGRGGQQQRPQGVERGEPSYETAGIMPQQTVREALKPGDRSIDDMRKLGFTAAQVVPNGRMLPGNGSLIMLGSGKTADDYIVKENTSLVATLTTSPGVYPATQIGVISRFEELYRQAQQLQAHTKAYAANPAGMVRPTSDRVLEAFFPVLDGKQPVYFLAPDVKSTARALALQKELGFQMIIAGVRQGWPLADQMKALNKPTFLSLDLPKAKKEDAKPAAAAGGARGGNRPGAEAAPKAEENAKPAEEAKPKDPEMEALEARRAAEMALYEGQAAAMTTKSIPFAFSAMNAKPAEIRENLRRMIKAGLTEDQALAALTTTPANIFGVSAMMGSVEKGKMANLVVTDQPYFNEKSNVRYVFVDGMMYEYEVKAAPKGNPNGSAKVGGRWSYNIAVPGQEAAGVFNFKDEGGNISGTWTSTTMPGENNMAAVTLKGNNLTFSSSIDAGGQSMTLEFDLVFEGNNFSGKVNVGSFGTFDVEGSRLGDPKN
ncbi:MAG: amidohydrolase family protein [Lewinellaceae bacterium]|nr:amidohydrolase family protein [Lewinellaceae bacterium]